MGIMHAFIFHFRLCLYMEVCIWDFVDILKTIQKGSYVCEDIWVQKVWRQRNPVSIESIFLQHHLKYPGVKRKSFI